MNIEMFMVANMLQLYESKTVWIGLEYNSQSQTYSSFGDKPVSLTNWYNNQPDPRIGNYVTATIHKGPKHFLFLSAAASDENHPFFCHKSIGMTLI